MCLYTLPHNHKYKNAKQNIKSNRVTYKKDKKKYNQVLFILAIQGSFKVQKLSSEETSGKMME